MFYKNPIENYTTFKNYQEFLEEVSNMGAKLHFDPPHVTFNKYNSLTGKEFQHFIINNLQEDICYADFYRLNNESGILEFLQIVDKYNDTSFAWNGKCNTHNFKVAFYSNNDCNDILVIPEGYSHVIKQILNS